MRTGNVLFSAAHFFVVLFFLGFGAFFVSLSGVAYLRLKISLFLSQHYEMLFPIGIFALVLGGILLIGLYALNRKSYYRVNLKAVIDRSVIQEYVENYWKKTFPELKISPQVVVAPHQKIEIVAEIPKTEIEEQTELLAKIESELGEILADALGYRKEFILTLRMA